MNLDMMQAVLLLLQGVLLMCLFMAFRYGLGLLEGHGRGKVRIPWRELLETGSPPGWLIRSCCLRVHRAEYWETQSQLLRAAGLQLHVLWYGCAKRIAWLLLFGYGFMCVKWRLLWMGQGTIWVWITLAGACGVILLASDRYLLEAAKRYRANRIVEEIYMVSKQLLYFSGSKRHLHGKLSRCTPFTKLIRNEWENMLNQWYYDPDYAISSFRQRLGTEEAYGFAETLRAMMSYDHETYYSLLQQRIQDFKERLELIRDSRKESASYLLFVLAGVPILYTFQIFMHPWVMEGKRLFEGLQ